MTLNREKLLELAKEAGFDIHPRNETIRHPDDPTCTVLNGHLERFASLVLSAAQEEMEPQPVAWVRRHPDGALTAEFLEDAVIEPVRRRSGAWVPLYLAPPSSNVQERLINAFGKGAEQGWNAAVEAAASVCDQHSRSSWNDDRRTQAKLDASDIRSLKRPLQAQEPNCGACPGDGSVCKDACKLAAESPASGAVDDLPPLPEPYSDAVPLTWAYDKPCFDDFPDLFTADQMREYARLSRSQAAQQAKPVRATPTETGVYAWHGKSSVALVMVNKRPSAHSPGGVLNGHVMESSRFYDGCPVDKWSGGRWFGPLSPDALLSQSAAPVSEQQAAQTAGVLIGEIREGGPLWFKANAHTYPIGTRFFAVPPSPQGGDK